MTLRTTIQTIIAAAVLVGAVLFGFVQNQANGSGFVGIAVTPKTATTTTIGPDTVVTIFSSLPYCTSRIISNTDGVGATIHFLTSDPTNGDLASTSLALTNGHVQGATTTVAYDAGLYGCGKWTAIATASTTITLVENQ